MTVELKSSCSQNNQDDVGQTTSDPFQDDCQSWLCCFCTWPPPSIYKSSCPPIVGGGSRESWPLDRDLPSPAFLASLKNKANCPFHSLASLIAFERWAAGPGIGNSISTWKRWQPQPPSPPGLTVVGGWGWDSGAGSWREMVGRWNHQVFTAAPRSRTPSAAHTSSPSRLRSGHLLRSVLGDFPGGSVAKTLCFQCRGLGSSPGEGSRYHMPKLWVCMPQQKIRGASTQTQCSQINKYLKQ